MHHKMTNFAFEELIAYAFELLCSATSIEKDIWANCDAERESFQTFHVIHVNSVVRIQWPTQINTLDIDSNLVPGEKKMRNLFTL